MANKLSERAMLVSLHRSGWGNSKVDKEITEDARARNNAERGSGRFTKVLVNPTFFNCVTRPLSQADAIYKRLTLPWTDGARIMSSMAHLQLSQEMYAQRQVVEIGRRELLTKEADIHAEAQRRLGNMYNRDEYPSIDEIADSFGFKVEFNKVPEGGDFRVNLANVTVKAIVKDIEDATKERLEKATSDVFLRVFGVVDKMVKTLKEYEPKTDTSKGKNFKDSLVYNVREVADLLPTLNINLDPRIDALQVELIDDLTQTPGAILKASDAAREACIAKAEKIIKKLQGYMP